MVDAERARCGEARPVSELDVQSQPKLTWPAAFVVARAYLDQLERGKGLSSDRIAAARDALGSAERAAGEQRRSALTQLGAQLDGYVAGASDAARVRALAGVVKELGRAN